MSVTVADLRTTLRTLEALQARGAVNDLDARQRTALLTAARALLDRPAKQRAPRVKAPKTTKPRVQPTVLRPCYVCHLPTVPDDDALCATCRLYESATAHAHAAAITTQLLRGHLVVVTGARTVIGYATALAALRLGAVVLGTTRFVDDAAARYAAEPDHDVWRERLHLHALDLRDLPGIERLAGRFVDDARAFGGISAVIHNAAQTLPLSNAAALQLSSSSSSPSMALLPAATQQALATLSASSLSTVLEHGPYGAPPDTSWRVGIDGVSTRELLEVMVINATAPFVLTRALLPSLRSSTKTPRVVVNVTSSEGRFSFAHDTDTDTDDNARMSDARSERGRKSHRHPHLNMAKAALNMLTRTTASELIVDDIVLVAVDPGWVSGPLPTGGFRSGRFPLFAEEAARRVLHPLVAAAQGSPPKAGVLYKNYRPSPW